MRSFLSCESQACFDPHEACYTRHCESKEHEVQVTATRRGARGWPAATARPQDKPPSGENFPQRSRENTNLIDHAQGPPAGPWGSACGFVTRSDAGQVRLEPTAQSAGYGETSSTTAFRSVWIVLRTPWQRVGAGGRDRVGETDSQL